jgi:hypothetical protein
MEMNYPIHNMPGLIAAEIVRINPSLKRLHKINSQKANALAMRWTESRVETALDEIREHFGTPLFATEWNQLDSKISDDEAWILARLNWYADAANIAARLGYECVAEFARDTETAYRLAFRKACLRLNLVTLATWRDALANELAVSN